MESPSAWASLGDGRENGSESSRSATTIEDMFSAPDKSRFDSPARNAYWTIRGGSVVRGVLRSREFEDGQVAESSTTQARGGPPKADQILPGSARPAVGRRPLGAPGWPVPATEARRIPAAITVRRPVPDPTGHARGRHQWRRSSLFPGLREAFRR
jgi:hypothetical protein